MIQENIKPYSFFRSLWDNLLSLIVLNILFILACLPVLTLPASGVALSRACGYCLMNEGKVISCFWETLKKSIVASFLPVFPFLFIMIGFLYGFLFYYQNLTNDFVIYILMCFCLIGAYVFFCFTAISCQIMARVNLNAKVVIKNTVLLIVLKPSLLISWLILAATIFICSIILFPYSLPLVILITFSLVCLCATKGVLPEINEKMITR